jgi:hypothetical protein
MRCAARVVCASVCPSVTSDKVHVRPISKYSSIFEHIEHILENIHRIGPLRPIPNRQNRPSVRLSRLSTTSLPPNTSNMTTLCTATGPCKPASAPRRRGRGSTSAGTCAHTDAVFTSSAGKNASASKCGRARTSRRKGRPDRRPRRPADGHLFRQWEGGWPPPSIGRGADGRPTASPSAGGRPPRRTSVGSSNASGRPADAAVDVRTRDNPVNN